MSFRFIAVFISVFVAGAGLVAQETPDASLGTAFRFGLGQYLIDSQGRSLYAFLQDAEGTSTCYDECAQMWPPFLVDAEPTLGQGLEPDLVGTVERNDGSIQATYNGWPLYYYSGDPETGGIEGQSLGGNWFLISREGDLLGADDAQAEGDAAGNDEPSGEGDEVDTELLAEYMELGETIYTSTASPACMTCHGAQGGGGAGPRLVGYARLADTERILNTIVHGGHIMPPFGGQLSNRQVAAVSTFIRNSWGNDFGLVTPEEVEAVR